MTVIERDGVEPKSMVSAVIVPSGVIRLPLVGDIEGFQAALQTVFDERAMLFAIPSDELYRVDSAHFADHPTVRPELDVPFWSATSTSIDGSTVTPLRSITLRRSQ